uniref:Putative secreted protein n=1 Tax=Anopheles marajoara TaxID=58244 RepID=A0A2M4C6H2_9DIPT
MYSRFKFICALRLPSLTLPIIQAECEVLLLYSSQKLVASPLGRQISNPPLVSTALPANSFALRPSNSAISRTFFMMGSLSIWKSTAAFWYLAKFSACPYSPNPVTSVAACALYLRISFAPMRLSRHIDSNAMRYVSSTSATLKRS